MFQVCQRSALSAFHFQALDMQGGLLADLVWPHWPQAKNARLRWNAPDSPTSDIQIRMGEALYRIGFEYLSRGFTNEIRFTLHQGGEPLAVADVLHPKGAGLKRMKLLLQHPLRAEFSPANRWGRVRYRLEQNGQCLGTVEETRWFTLKRELTVNMPPQLSLPVQVFLAFLTVQAAFS